MWYLSNSPAVRKACLQNGSAILETILVICCVCLIGAASIKAFTARVAFRVRCADYALGGGTLTTTGSGIDQSGDGDDLVERQAMIDLEIRQCGLKPPVRR